MPRSSASLICLLVYEVKVIPRGLRSVVAPH